MLQLPRPSGGTNLRGHIHFYVFNQHPPRCPKFSWAVCPRDLDTSPWSLPGTSNFTSKTKCIICLSSCFPSESLNAQFTHPPEPENQDSFPTLSFLSRLCSLISFFKCSWLYLLSLLHLSLCLPLYHQRLPLVLPRWPQHTANLSFLPFYHSLPLLGTVFLPLRWLPLPCRKRFSHSWPIIQALCGPASKPQRYPLDFTISALINTEWFVAALSHKFLA